MADVRGELSARCERAIDVRRARRMIGLAGTVTALCALTLGLDAATTAARTHHSAAHARRRSRRCSRACARRDLHARRRMLAEPKRAEVIVGGAAVLLTILREFGIRRADGQRVGHPRRFGSLTALAFGHNKRARRENQAMPLTMATATAQNVS